MNRDAAPGSGRVQADPPADERHARLAAAARSALVLEERTSKRVSGARLAVAGLTIAAGLAALEAESPAALRWLAVAGALVFLALVRRHERVERRVTWQRTLAALHDEAAARVRRAWDRLPDPAMPAADPHHPFAADLDLFGRASLFELIGPPGTDNGREKLASWLTGPSDPADLVARQDAVRDLSARRELRLAIVAHARLVTSVAGFDLVRLLEWSESAPWLCARPWLLWGSRLLALATPALLLLQAGGIVAGAWWLATAALGFVLSWAVRGPLETALGRSGAWERAIRAYRDLLETLERAPLASARLTTLKAALLQDGRRASREIAGFERLVALADLRHAPLLHVPVHALTLWDFHVWAALERWQERNGRRLRAWVDTIGEVEALAALAGLADDHPGWCYPHVDPGATAFEAGALGHPLLPNATRVLNDVTVGPPGRVLCVTGSNMSGKSTLLRAIGVNAVLAQSGGPVCAARLRMPPVALYTSLRISDSLEEGVSYFMAALARLRAIVEAASGATAAGPIGPVVLYLLDEILQGTNTVERELAVRVIVRHLAASRAIGAVTTHDLGLTATPELRSRGDHVHFAETVDAIDSTRALSFDYRLRPGVATSRNALRLMELVGLLARDEVSALEPPPPG